MEGRFQSSKVQGTTLPGPARLAIESLPRVSTTSLDFSIPQNRHINPSSSMLVFSASTQNQGSTMIDNESEVNHPRPSERKQGSTFDIRYQARGYSVALGHVLLLSCSTTHRLGLPSHLSESMARSRSGTSNTSALFHNFPLP